MAQQFPLSKENFEHLDIPNLLINIWSYNDQDHHLNVGNCETCRKYEKWSFEIAKSKWQPEFKSFAFVIPQIQIQNKKFFNFGNVSSADRNSIFKRYGNVQICTNKYTKLYVVFLFVVREVHFLKNGKLILKFLL